MSIDKNQGAKRLLTLHERFSLTRHTSGHPTILTVGFTYPSASDAPSLNDLRQRVKLAQKHFPLLYAKVDDPYSRTPSFVLNDKPWQADDIVGEGELKRQGDADDLSSAIIQELDRFGATDLFTGPMWSVRLLRSSNSDKTFLTVSAIHIILDGRGSEKLALALATPPSAPGGLDSLPMEDLVGPTRADDTLDIKPSLAYLAPIAWRELLLPKLPIFIQSALSYTPLGANNTVWPVTEEGTESAAPDAKPPIDCPSETLIVSLEPELVASLKAKGKASQVPTLHPLLEAALMTSMWSVLHTDSKPDTPFWLEVSTPRDERLASLGHSYCTSNYVSSTPYMSGLQSTTRFWDLARDIARFNSSPSGIAKGRMQMGLLSHVPDSEPTPSPEDPQRAVTGWETFFTTKARGITPYTSSACLSNLGYATLPPGASDIAWAQTADAFSAALSASAIGSAAGVRVAMSWKDGSVVRRDEVARIMELFGHVLRQVADGEDSTLGDMSATGRR